MASIYPSMFAASKILLFISLNRAVHKECYELWFAQVGNSIIVQKVIKTFLLFKLETRCEMSHLKIFWALISDIDNQSWDFGLWFPSCSLQHVIENSYFGAYFGL